MGTLVALYKLFDLSLRNLLNINIFISFLFCFVSTVPFYPRKKEKKRKEKKEQGVKKEKIDKMY